MKYLEKEAKNCYENNLDCKDKQAVADPVASRLSFYYSHQKHWRESFQRYGLVDNFAVEKTRIGPLGSGTQRRTEVEN